MVNKIGSKRDWYEKAKIYWKVYLIDVKLKNIDASMSGVLGGFEVLNDPDI